MRKGSIDERVFVTAYSPGRPRSSAAAAAAFDERVRQARELVLGEVEDVALLVGEDVVGEARVELGEALVDRGVALLRFAVERGAVAGEAVVDELDEAELVGPQAEVVPLRQTAATRSKSRSFCVIFEPYSESFGAIRSWISRNSGDERFELQMP